MSAHRVTALTGGAVDPDAKAIHFSIAVTDRPPIPFIMEFGPSTQLIGALGRMFLTLQEIAQREKGAMTSVAKWQALISNRSAGAVT